jgi:integrase
MKILKAYKTAQGNWQVNFSEGGKQRTLYLGREFDSASAGRVARIVTDILSCRKRGETLPIEILRRVEDLPDRVRKSFERFGLAGGVSKWTISDLVDLVLQSKSHLKPRTRERYQCCGKLLIDFFGKDRRLDTIEKLDCERLKNRQLTRHAACTVFRDVVCFRTFFRIAVDDVGWLQKNPFAKVSGGSKVNLDRQIYVDRETIYRVMEHCRDDYDRLLLALARFGGLRIPSEVKQLRFCDITDKEIRIHSDTKTGARAVPLFGEVREIFDRIVEMRKMLAQFSPGELIFVNLASFRFRMVAAIQRSGVKCWCKLFVNLRSSCITDMVERRYSDKMLDSMFGNSPMVRSRHYIQFCKEKEYAKALEDNERMLRFLREGGVENVLSPEVVDELLVFRDLLVNRFGTGRKGT